MGTSLWMFPFRAKITLVSPKKAQLERNTLKWQVVLVCVCVCFHKQCFAKCRLRQRKPGSAMFFSTLSNGFQNKSWSRAGHVQPCSQLFLLNKLGSDPKSIETMARDMELVATCKMKSDLLLVLKKKGEMHIAWHVQDVLNLTGCHLEQLCRLKAW